MSLLMDALKKAELAKRQGRAGADDGGDVEATAGGISLEPLPNSEPVVSATPAPEPLLQSQLEALDAKFLAEVQQSTVNTRPAGIERAPESASARPVTEGSRTSPSPAAPASRAAAKSDPKPQAEQSAAQNVFAVKHVEKPAARKSFLIASGIFTVAAMSAIGGYVWWEIQPKSSLLAANSNSTIAMRSAPPPPLQAPTPAPAQTIALSTDTAATPMPPPPVPVGATPKGQPSEADDEEETPKVTSRAQRRASTPRVIAELEPEGPVHVTRAPLKVNPGLTRGFDAFNRGDYSTAHDEYEKVLKSDPRNTDALHGLAAIALRQGKPEQAEWYNQRLLEADPRDAIALANLINSRSQIDPIAAESRLKTLTAEQPDLAAPHFALGNLYAKQSRWNEAQQSYFRAYGAEPENADILYNLAISLEHLRQNKLAGQYYGLAASAAKKHPGAFDPEQAIARVRALQP